jgi:hypothetical protein
MANLETGVPGVHMLANALGDIGPLVLGEDEGVE